MSEPYTHTEHHENAVKDPPKPWAETYFHPSLLASKAYAIDSGGDDIQVKIDQNESPWDVPVRLKQKILTTLENQQWNRYPSSQSEELTQKLGKYVNIAPKNILTGPGSNYLISLILSAMGTSLKGDVVIARPSFGLFEASCRYAGISYRTWDLGPHFEFLPQTLSPLPTGSLVVFASPNNPTGSVLPYEDLQSLLESNRHSFFIADEAYFEFTERPVTELLRNYDNLLIIRTFSKSVGVAGIRFGYAIASETIIQQLTKLRLPYLLNHFTIVGASAILDDHEYMEQIHHQMKQVIMERDQMMKALENLTETKNRLQISVFPSQGNFFLMKCPNQELGQQLYKELIKSRILVRDVSNGPQLSGCLRISVGTPKDNQTFLETVKSIANQKKEEDNRG